MLQLLLLLGLTTTAAATASQQCSCIQKPTACPSGTQAQRTGNCGNHGQDDYFCCVPISPTATNTPKAVLNVGTGIYDVTGPAADINFMGYALMSQVGRGIHFRLRSRAFVFETKVPTPPLNSTRLFAFASVDMGMGSSAVTNRVLELLDAEPTTTGKFTNDNLCISGTHTHSAPAGFLTHTIFQVTSLGFCKQSYNAFATGIAQSIIKAVGNMAPGRVFLGQGKVDNANINRSPTAYTFNPLSERKLYPDGNTDKDMTLLKFMSEDNTQPIGMVNWYSVHGTAMNNTNKLISGDNKGRASALFEASMNPPGTLPGKGKFVGAFAATNLGDVSPNINGSFCMDTGLPCEMKHSTCNGKNEMCTGRGPGQDMFESTNIIATRQFQAATQIWNNAKEELLGKYNAYKDSAFSGHCSFQTSLLVAEGGGL